MSADDLDYTRPTRSEKKQSAALEGVNGAVGIRNGVQCINYVVDQNTVMFLLNKVPSTAGGALLPTGPTLFNPARAGFCEPSLSQAIKRFQQANGLKADGVVDPRGPTSARMRVLATGVPPTSVDTSFEARVVNSVKALIDVLRIAAQRLAGGPEAVQFQAIAQELDTLLREQSGATPELRFRFADLSATLIENLISIRSLAALIDLDIRTLRPPSSLGKVSTLSDDTLSAIRVRAQRTRDLADNILAANKRIIVRGLTGISGLVGKSEGKCAPAIQALLIRTGFLESLTAKLPVTDVSTGKEMVLAARDWMAALAQAAGCMGDEGVPLLKFVQGGLEGGVTLIGALQKLLGVANLLAGAVV
jgi:peptidoglycan hydrolase-like protein with peptidoglycan-binding domain